MDYSKTHYYKFSNSAPASPRKSTIPDFEHDDMPVAYANNMRTAQNSQRTTNDVPATPGFGPVGPVTPTVPGGSNNTPSQPSTGGTNIFWSWAFLSPIFSNISAVAQARFYNVAAIQEPLDIYLNGQLIVSDLDYSEYTDYLYIIPGYYNLTVYRRTNPDVAIINARVSFARNSVCTISILGDMNGFSLQFIC